MTRLTVSRSLVAVLAVWAAVSVALALTTVGPTDNWGLFDGGGDLDVYRKGAWHVMSGVPLYELPVDKKLFYTYTPFSALLFIPLDLLPSVSDRHLFLAANLVVLTAVVVQCWRLVGYRVSVRLVGVSVLLALGCVFLEPVRTTLFFGQINLILMLLVLADAVGGTRSRVAGVGTGVAAGIKLTPLFFVLYFAVLRQWRVVAVAVSAFVTTLVIGFVLLPQDSRTYWGGTFLRSERIGDTLIHPSNQSLRGAMARISGDYPPTWLWLALAVPIVAASLWTALRLYRFGDRLLAVTLVGLTSAVVSPFSWTHHWVWVVPLIVWLVHRALNSWTWWLVPAGLFVAMGAWPHWFRGLRDPRIGFYLFPDTYVPDVMLRNSYVWLYAILLVACVAYTLRVGRRANVVDGQNLSVLSA
ncbi:alpha-1,2-mannosyltransferase [Mycolicibacterium iranicum]|uniref:Alpha-1,2-mannosyltransferase n=1 Tax=Mycolicibacterium iranicum TaxID=912594 RepID=A0A839Q7E1_MYCIR|nr:glycosyltransferase 87 family protein [Mycolicibacterium iranicum]MBB2989132.1 alpha-1,2-mannosyltransferase [Mycolicibacterium iranicum]